MNKLLLNIILTIAIWLNASSVFAKEKIDDRRILIISSYNPETINASNAISDFANYFDNNGNGGTILVENMNCKSLTEAHLWRDRMLNILHKYNNDSLRPAIIILMGQEAWASYLSVNPKNIDQIANIPVMSCMASRNIVRMPNDTCTLESWLPTSIDYTFLKSRYNIVDAILYEYDIEKNLEIINGLYPSTKTIALLTDNSYGGLTMLAHVNDYMKKHKEYKFIRLDGRHETIYTMSERIDKLPKNTTLLLGTWRVDKTESYYVKNSTHLLRDANKDLNVLTLTNVGIGYWAIGGYIPQYHSQGKEMAEKVIRYFTDIENNLPVNPDQRITIVPGRYLFDEDKLNSDAKKSGYNIPENISFINTKPSFYQEHQVFIIIVAIAFGILLTILCTVLFFYAKTRSLSNALQHSQKELIKARDKAEESNKMKTAFLANMSHEIRTPLNAIVGFSDILTTDTSLNEADKIQINDIISKNSQMLLNLINDVLDLARLESGRTKYTTESCDVVELCHDTLATCKIAARREEITYVLDTNMDSCMAILDKQHIRQVLINLMSNAVKFTKSGTITLSIHRVGDHLRFAVTDTGIGIPKDKFNTVFERFEKLDEISKGFGIGLSLCKNIVEHFKGKIWVDPAYTQGARFIFIIPFIEPTDNDDQDKEDTEI